MNRLKGDIMAVCIRLSRTGMKNTPHYRVVAADDRKPRDGKFIEVLGTYDPKKTENKLTIKRDRLEYWTKNGARISETISQLI